VRKGGYSRGHQKFELAARNKARIGNVGAVVLTGFPDIDQGKRRVAFSELL